MAGAVKRTEAEVAEVVMNHMISEGWDCYPEVMMPYGGRADIVGVRPLPFAPHRHRVHIVECKTSWSLSLLDQALERLPFANYVSIAAPTKPGRIFERICRLYGIGMILFAKRADLTIDEYRYLDPRPVRRSEHGLMGPKRLVATLDPDMKRYAPGTTSDKGFSTPWRRTMDRAVAFVAKHPGCTVNDLLKSIEYHYSTPASARQGLLLWLSKRDDIEARREGPSMRFYPVVNHEP